MHVYRLIQSKHVTLCTHYFASSNFVTVGKKTELLKRGSLP